MVDRALSPAIEVDHLSTSYRVHLDASSTWAGIVDLLHRSTQNDRLIPALRDITFDLPRGSVLGIVGRNGAGKSTLLRCLAGILAPEEGRVVVRGRISALLNVGVGMNEALSGRENIKLGGLAMGISSQRLEEITDSIAEFAQLGDYIEFPVRTYSAGMRMRLGFAVAAHLDPEVLLIDETLAGGDAKFKEKTAEKMAELCGHGRTIVLVSHGLSAVRLMASHGMWLHQGRIAEFGDPDQVVASYMRYCRLEASELVFDDE